MIKKYKTGGIQEPYQRTYHPSFVRGTFVREWDGFNGSCSTFGYVSLDATLQYAHINRPDYVEVYRRCHPGIVGAVNRDQNGA